MTGVGAVVTRSRVSPIIQASQYHEFAATTLLAMGLPFQVPVGIVAITRAGIISSRRLRKSRRLAVVV
jgi:sec-independent protein translocase protein TatC